MLTFTFTGYVRRADITKVTITETGDELDVTGIADQEIADKLNSGEWSIALGDYLYCSQKNEIDMQDFDVDDS